MRKICKYGVTLREVQSSDLETLRAWRNDPEISRYMLTQDHITRDQQQEWYRVTQQRGDINFVIHYNGRDIGFLGLKKVAEDGREYNPGVYFAEAGAQNSHLPFLAAFCLWEYIFATIPDVIIRTKVLASNSRAVRFNRALGYREVAAPTDDDGAIEMELLAGDFYAASARLKKILKLEE